MADITEQQVIEAAQKLGKDEFNRQDIATALGVEKADVKKPFTQARKAGYFEKVRDDDENTGIFKLGAKLAEVGAPGTPASAGSDAASGTRDAGVVGDQIDR